MATEHPATLRQSVPRLRKLLSQMEPTFELESVAHVDAAFILEHGIRAVLWDVDGTLMRYHGEDIDPQFQHVRRLFRDGPAWHAILSNCDENRFKGLGNIFPEVPLIRGYITNDGPAFRHRFGGVDTHSDAAVDRILSGGGRQMRKPASELIQYAMEIAEVHDPNAVLMVGDQYLTDVASANLAGVLSAKVATFRRNTFPAAIRASQMLESAIYALFYARRK
jgi:predicted HAD superfamily phosphohydrolase YqeG